MIRNVFAPLEEGFEGQEDLGQVQRRWAQEFRQELNLKDEGRHGPGYICLVLRVLSHLTGVACCDVMENKVR